MRHLLKSAANSPVLNHPHHPSPSRGRGHKSCLLNSLLAASLAGASLQAADPAGDTRQQEAALLKEVKVPEGFEANIFATPPSVNYPVFVSAAPDGTVYVSSDKNGSLDRAPHRGRVLRARDTDGDGRADEVKQFVPDVDSPRGLVWDHDRLYLLHPPHLSVYIDHDGDGVADEEKVLVKNIAFTFKDRPADHSSNGLELGIDGWIYCAIGDFGFMEAEGTDGRKLQLRGGGVVRVRPDGTGLELFSHGTRNILEVAVSPLLEAFARDNTNDGGGWDVRFHHFVGLSEHGYPSLFKNFPGEFIEPLADYGGGSGCGAMFLSEPGFPEGYNDSVYTADWGREWTYRHHPVASGATFTIDQKEFVRAPRVTDLDVDALSHIYVSSWKGATFTYVGENVGFLVRVSPKGYTPEPLPDFNHATAAGLIKLLESPSHRRRLEAQRELVRRGLDDTATRQLTTLSSDGSKPLATRVAAIFALKQGLHGKATPILAGLAQDASIREYAIRALCDNLGELDGINAETLINGLADANPRVRREAVFALARLGRPENATALTPLLADSDAVVAHSAVQAMKALKGTPACFAVVDQANAPEMQRVHALQVLQSVHETGVVEGLVNRLSREADPARRRGLFTALCRLYFTAGEWKGDSWGTRPDTSGPYYQTAEWSETPRIAAALKTALATAKGEEAAFYAAELGRHKVQTDETLTQVVALAAKDDSLLPMAISQLARAEHLPATAFPLLARTAEGPDAALRARSVVALTRIGNDESIRLALKALGQIDDPRSAGAEAQQARDAFLNSPKIAEQHELLESTAAKLDGNASAWADAALLKLAARNNGSPEARDAAAKALEAGWANPKRRGQILHAIQIAEQRDWRDKVLAAADDADPTVAEAAKKVAAALRLDRPRRQAPANQLIEKMKVEDVIAAVTKEKGDRKLGEELFTRQGCVNCHTVQASQPLKGPFLGNIATLYKRPELAEAILLPSKTLAQGFVTHHFELKDGTEVDGFVTQEAADKVTIRNVAAQEIQIAVGDIAKRVKTDRSIMPEGLAANLNVKELASLLDYLEGLAGK